jgi:hypothetical protein
VLEPFFRMGSPNRDPFVLWRAAFGAEAGRPRVAFVSGLHGEELNGPVALALLNQFLEQVVRGTATEYRLKGRVLILPVVNTFGYNAAGRAWPFDQTDVNRMFPGYVRGETTQRIAAAVEAACEGCDFAVDLHSSNEKVLEVPQVRVYGADAATVERARSFGLDFVWSRRVTPSVRAQFSWALAQRGAGAFVVQAGVARQVDLEACRQVMQALVRFLCASGTLEGPSEPPRSARPWVFDNAQVAFVYGTRAGLFLPQVKPGARVAEGTTLGTVIGVLEGEVRERVRSPCLGTVISLRNYPVVYEGELLARVAAPVPIPGAEERSEYEAQ